MEYEITEAFNSQLKPTQSSDALTNKRLERLISANAEFARERLLYRSFAEKIEAKTMRHPLVAEKAFSYYCLMLRSLPPAAFFILFTFAKGQTTVEPFVFILMVLTNTIAALTGYHSGKVIGTIVRKIEKRPLSQKILLFTLLGAFWGVASGAACGIFLFVFGAIFGGIIGGAVGAVALPLFAFPYLAMKRGDVIDLRHFLPISFGATLAISAYILGFLYP